MGLGNGGGRLCWCLSHRRLKKFRQLQIARGVINCLLLLPKYINVSVIVIIRWES